MIFTREALHELPYSVEEVYGIKTSGKYHRFEKMYHRQENCIYAGNGKAENVLTEDSRAGYEFYRYYYDGKNVSCFSAGSNSGIYPYLRSHCDQKVVVVADGAAFGPEMARVMKLQRQYPENITVCLPECFEWLILRSGLIAGPALAGILEEPVGHIECREYFSWENFFTDILIRYTAGTHYAYSKSELNNFYTVKENSGKIVAVIASALP